jgi:hypothetical protein
MKPTQLVIILLAIVLVAAIGYSFFLHWGPLKNILNENQDLKIEIARLKTASEKIKAGYESDLTAKIQNRRVGISPAPLHGSPGRRN